MSLAYRLLYAVGYTPWEQVARLQVVHERISALFEREEEGRRPPYGQALDLGCGSGIWVSNWRSAGGRSPEWTSSRRPCAALAGGHGRRASRCGSSRAT